jgi:hypothetical protein
VNDLVQWLGEQLDMDERIARGAGDGFRQIGETGVIVATEGDRAEECASANWHGIAEHIVAHDPAQVLREIDAKRQLLRKYAEVEANDLNEVEYAHGYANALGEAVRMTALSYTDRPGYREDWRP